MTFGLGRHLWDVPATQAIDLGEVITHESNPQRKHQTLRSFNLVAVHHRDGNDTGMASGQTGLLLVIQTSVRTEPNHEVALLRRSLRLYSPLYCRILPHPLHMHPGAEAVRPEIAGSLLAERGRRIRHSHIQRDHRLLHAHIASTFCLVSAYEAVSKTAVDSVVWTWSFV